MPKVIHFEIPADDPMRAVEFYKKTTSPAANQGVPSLSGRKKL